MYDTLCRLPFFSANKPLDVACASVDDEGFSARPRDPECLVEKGTTTKSMDTATTPTAATTTPAEQLNGVTTVPCLMEASITTGLRKTLLNFHPYT